MRTDTIDRVLVATKDQAEMTVREIEQRTGLSYNTVLTALDLLNAELVPGTKPRKWRIIEGIKSASVQKPSGEFVDKLVSRWNEGRNRIGSGIASIEITPQSDPKALAESFEQGAATMANAAYTLRQVTTKPDWFVLVGGNLEDSQVN